MRIDFLWRAARAKHKRGIIAQVVWNAHKSVGIGHAIDAGYPHIDDKHQMILTFGKQGRDINFAALIPYGAVFKLKAKGLGPQRYVKLIKFEYLHFKRPYVAS